MANFKDLKNTIKALWVIFSETSDNLPSSNGLSTLITSTPSLFTTLFFFYWSIVDLQCCVNFWYTAQWFSYTIYMFFFHYGWSHDIEYSSLSYTVGHCCLSYYCTLICHFMSHATLFSFQPCLIFLASPFSPFI